MVHVSKMRSWNSKKIFLHFSYHGNEWLLHYWMFNYLFYVILGIGFSNNCSYDQWTMLNYAILMSLFWIFASLLCLVISTFILVMNPKSLISCLWSNLCLSGESSKYVSLFTNILINYFLYIKRAFKRGFNLCVI